MIKSSSYLSCITKTTTSWPCSYALELLKFREAGVEVILKVVTNLFYRVWIQSTFCNFLSHVILHVQDFRKRWDRQSQAFYNLFRQADRVEKLADIIQRLVCIGFSLTSFELFILFASFVCLEFMIFQITSCLSSFFHRNKVI